MNYNLRDSLIKSKTYSKKTDLLERKNRLLSPWIGWICRYLASVLSKVEILDSYFFNTCLKLSEHIFCRTLAAQLDFTSSRSTIETCEKRNLTTITTTNRNNGILIIYVKKEFATLSFPPPLKLGWWFLIFETWTKKGVMRKMLRNRGWVEREGSRRKGGVSKLFHQFS